MARKDGDFFNEQLEGNALDGTDGNLNYGQQAKDVDYKVTSVRVRSNGLVQEKADVYINPEFDNGVIVDFDYIEQESVTHEPNDLLYPEATNLLTEDELKGHFTDPKELQAHLRKSADVLEKEAFHEKHDILKENLTEAQYDRSLDKFGAPKETIKDLVKQNDIENLVQSLGNNLLHNMPEQSLDTSSFDVSSIKKPSTNINPEHVTKSNSTDPTH